MEAVLAVLSRFFVGFRLQGTLGRLIGSLDRSDPESIK